MRQKKTKKKNIFKEIISWIFYLAVFCGAVFLIVQYVGERTVVIGDSMYPSLEDGDNLIVDKISYRFTNPDRFDIVVFPFRYQEDTFYIKRVIALPGETIQIREGSVYINGSILDDPYKYEEIRSSGLASEPLTLGQDEYFVLGDNRNSSADSREPSVGTVSGEDIIGRAVFRIWPARGVGFLR